jgi:hypothetical protein
VSLFNGKLTFIGAIMIMGDYHDFKFDQHDLYSYQTLKILNKLSQ